MLLLAQNPREREVNRASNDEHRWSLIKTSSIPCPLYPFSSRLAPASGSETAQDSRHRLEQNVVLVETDVKACQNDLRQLQNRFDGLSDIFASALNRNRMLCYQHSLAVTLCPLF
ncbi:hypothetical protein K435DRAFT_970246 [Dendrothele bispora CBS 962.96]|uniref:Uncharacterized protein n=1 Tax=Dendrothele bispora (strain CBS 962.96) TaxID=1314807 RepID=A0A4S8LCD5_DENBC|nr:hypothetical protein K435DRAFT_970246 [Dendrothele bispora CBS 962.96]